MVLAAPLLKIHLHTNNKLRYICGMSKSNMYNLVSSIIDGMEIGEKKTVPLPDNMPYFRKYLSEISKRQDLRFTTKIVGDELEIMRIKYHNIYSREVE